MVTVRNKPSSSIKLSTTSYLVLGLIAVVGPATPYDLKRVVANSIGYFWTFPHSQLYTEPERLAAAGLLNEEREETGRRRRTFAITDEGRAALQDWLAVPVAKPTEIRDLGVLKLYFGGLVGKGEVVELAEAQQAAHKQRLAEYEAIESHEWDPGMDYPLATLRLGMAFERTAIEFWRSVADAPPG